MAKIVFQDIEEFYNWLPLAILTALKTDDILDDPAFEYFADIEKKILPVTRQYFRAAPGELRQKLKFFIKGLESNSNTTITIKPDSNKQSSITAEQKYLKNTKHVPIESVILRDLGE